MYKISKQFSFSASHVLDQLDEGHPCARLHGHNYKVKVYLQAEMLDGYGFVRDYRDLDAVKHFIDEKLDHRHLNDVLPFPPTAEHIARFLYEQFKPELPELSAVEVCETPQTSCLYEP
ncbi:MAG: 6-carboxytetrahydropterin synthase QueD [Tannerella sp.]|jgi:6-pyruvoyltetrahydropterin/6-carboxytetrahydropterin synthase|nr:6-carboxytetrahydropterin synthase QueD [Tannerella sp.]